MRSIIAIDNCCALEVRDEKYRILRSKASAKAYKVYWKKGKYIREEIKFTREFSDLNTLLKKWI